MLAHSLRCPRRPHPGEVSTRASADGRSGGRQPRRNNGGRAEELPSRDFGVGGRDSRGGAGRGSSQSRPWGGSIDRRDGGDYGSGPGPGQGRGRTGNQDHRNSDVFRPSTRGRGRGGRGVGGGGGGRSQPGWRARRYERIAEEGDGYSDDKYGSNEGQGDSDDDDDDDDGIDEGFVVIGRADHHTASVAAAQTRAKTKSAAADGAAPVATAARRGAASDPASDPLDGTRFWIEASGIDDLDEEEDEEGEEEEEEEGGVGDEDEDDGPETPEELLDNMRNLGFTLQGAEPPAAATAATTPSLAMAAKAGADTVAVHPPEWPAAVDPENTETTEPQLAEPGPIVSPSDRTADRTTAAAAGADRALRDLRDAFIVTMKPPSLPPWFLGPVEVAAPPRRRSGASAGGVVGRGTCLRTTRAVVPGELLAVSLPLAIRYCRRGTTPENEELADLMLGAAEPSAVAATAALSGSPPGGDAAAAVGAAGGLQVAAVNHFPGLTDLQQSLLGILWRGHPSGSGSQAAAGAPLDVSEAGLSAAAAAAAAPAAEPVAEAGSGAGWGSAMVKRAFLEIVAQSAADGGAPRSTPLLGRSELYRLVNLNCLGEDFQDLALCQLRGEPSLGHLAMWPEAAFTAHSCAPNATAYAVGDRLLIRAVAEIPKGGEVSLNWLGALLTAPLEQRRQELRQQYGFTCGCVRCTAEARYSDTPLAALMSSTYTVCQELAPRLDAAITEGDVVAVAAARERLLGMQAEVEAAMRAASPKVNAKVRRWLQACVYDMYDLISLCADELAAAAALGTLQAALGGKGAGKAAAVAAASSVVETESLAQCCRILEGVAPGSDGHVHLAAELVMRSLERFGPQHEEYRQARAGLVRAYGARYGNVGPAIMEQLVAARLAAETWAEEAAEAGGEVVRVSSGFDGEVE